MYDTRRFEFVKNNGEFEAEWYTNINCSISNIVESVATDQLVLFVIFFCYTQAMDPIEEILTRGVANIISNSDELRKTLVLGRKLNIYLGIDPTATRIHIGHAVPLRKLQALADLGHNVTFLIGDFTSLIGDTSDKDAERPVLTTQQIMDNFITYKRQAEKVLDFSKVQIKHNSEWLKELSFEDIIKLAQNFSVGDFVGRELVRRRLDDGKRVGLHEFLYPVMQGYDSYFQDTDIQIGGTDQTFNMQAGRTLQKNLRNKDSFVLSTALLEGTDGRKMSKSWGNAIWLEDRPEDMFAKTMAIGDQLIIQYFTLATNLSFDEINKIKAELETGINPMNMKKRLALRIVTELHSETEAISARENFEKTVQHKELPLEIQEIQLSADDEEFLNEDFLVELGMASSKSEAKRLFEQGGVELDGERVTDPKANKEIKDNAVLKIGKRRVVKLRRPL